MKIVEESESYHVNISVHIVMRLIGFSNHFV